MARTPFELKGKTVFVAGHIRATQDLSSFFD
jgi:hypothetical protein